LQQSAAAAPRLQAKGHNDDEATCPAVEIATKNAVELTGRENEAAGHGGETGRASSAARPLPEARAPQLIWKEFRLDYNDPVTRCKFRPRALPLIGSTRLPITFGTSE